MNSTNIQLTTKVTGTDETDDWPGQKIILYVDDNVSFGGKLVGGIRIRRAAQPKQRQPLSQAVKAGADFDDMDEPPWVKDE